MKKEERVELTDRIRQDIKEAYQKGKEKLGKSERCITSYYNGENASSVPKDFVMKVYSVLGKSPPNLSKWTKKNVKLWDEYCEKTGKVKKFLEFYLSMKKAEGIRYEEIRKSVEKGDGFKFSLTTYSKWANPKKTRYIPKAVLEFCIDSALERHSEEEIKKYCRIKNIGELKTVGKIATTAGLRDAVKKFKLENSISDSEYARLSKLGRKDIGNFLEGKTKKISTKIALPMSRKYSKAVPKSLDKIISPEKKFGEIVEKFAAYYPEMKKMGEVCVIAYIDRLIRINAPRHGISEDNAKKIISAKLEKEGYIASDVDSSICNMLKSRQEIKKIRKEKMLEALSNPEDETIYPEPGEFLRDTDYQD